MVIVVNGKDSSLQEIFCLAISQINRVLQAKDKLEDKDKDKGKYKNKDKNKDNSIYSDDRVSILASSLNSLVLLVIERVNLLTLDLEL